MLLATARMRHELALVACIPAVFVAMVMGFSMVVYAADTWGIPLSLASPALAWFGARELARRYSAPRDLLVAIYLTWAVGLACALVAVGFPDQAA